MMHCDDVLCNDALCDGALCDDVLCDDSRLIHPWLCKCFQLSSRCFGPLDCCVCTADRWTNHTCKIAQNPGVTSFKMYVEKEVV